MQHNFKQIMIIFYRQSNNLKHAMFRSVKDSIKKLNRTIRCSQHLNNVTVTDDHVSPV